MFYKVRIEDDEIDNGNDSTSNITTKLKAIDTDKANAELEKNEIVFSPDGSLKKVVGKTHAQGGVPLSLQDNSFILSDFKKLAIPKTDLKLFELKSGGKKLSTRTPASILSKEIDIKHHNKSLSVIDSKDHDTISKKSAQLMLNKNMEVIGQVAYLQEKQKKFPNGVPSFSTGTAPIYSKFTDQAIKESKQYMQQGGQLPQFQNGAQYPTIAQILEKQKQAKLRARSVLGLAVDSGIGLPIDQSLQNRWGIPSNFGVDPNFKQPSYVYGTPEKKDVGAETGDIKYVTEPTRYNPKMPLYAQLNIAKPFFDAATVKTIYPMGQQQESVIPQMEEYSAQPQVNAINQSYFNAAQLAKLSPNSNAYREQLYGNRIDKLDEILGTAQNKNTEIRNNQRVAAATSLNNDAGQNRLYDLTYKTGVDTALQRTQEMRDFHKNTGLTNLNDAIAKQQAFKNALNSPANKQYKTDKVIGQRMVNGRMVPVYEKRALYEPTPNMFGYDVNYIPHDVNFTEDITGTVDKQDYFDVAKKQIESMNVSDAQKIQWIKFLEGVYKAKTLQNIPFDSGQTPAFSGQVGGKYRNKKYAY